MDFNVLSLTIYKSSTIFPKTFFIFLDVSVNVWKGYIDSNTFLARLCWGFWLLLIDFNEDLIGEQGALLVTGFLIPLFEFVDCILITEFIYWAFFSVDDIL